MSGQGQERQGKVLTDTAAEGRGVGWLVWRGHGARGIWWCQVSVVPRCVCVCVWWRSGGAEGPPLHHG